MFGRSNPETNRLVDVAGIRVGLLLAFGMSILILTLPAQAAAPVLRITLSYGQAADGYTMSFVGEFIRLNPTNQGYGGDVVATVTPGAIVTVQRLNTASPRTASDLINDLKGRIASTVNQTAATMVQEMQSQNSASGAFEYRQSVLLPGNQKAVLAWRMVVDSSGVTRYGDPEVVPEDPLTLDVVYTPLNLSATLPASWPKYTDAGVLKWRLLDRSGAAKTGWTSIATSGVFDDPESINGAAVDTDAGLKCLILDRARCGGPTDVAALMQQQGASGAYVTYTRRLAPVYDNVPDPAAPGQYLQQPRISLSITNRTLAYNGCGGNLSYRNQGSYGYTLATHSEKYYVDSGLRYFSVDWADGTQISPTKSYDKTASVGWGSAGSIGSQVISPADGDSSLVAVSSVPGLIYLAPVSSGSPPVIEQTFSPPRGPFGNPISTANDLRDHGSAIHWICNYLLPGSSPVQRSDGTWARCGAAPAPYVGQCDWGSCVGETKVCDYKWSGGWYTSAYGPCPDQGWCNGSGIETITCRLTC